MLAEDTPGQLTSAGTINRWYLPDFEGSVRKVVDDANHLIRQIDYDAFGNVTATAGPGPTPAAGGWMPRSQYTGQVADPDTGLSFYGARWYDPHMGRFLSEDPAGEGTNYFAYVRNNPLNYTDPTGMRAFSASESITSNSQLSMTSNPNSFLAGRSDDDFDSAIYSQSGKYSSNYAAKMIAVSNPGPTSDEIGDRLVKFTLSAIQNSSPSTVVASTQTTSLSRAQWQMRTLQRAGIDVASWVPERGFITGFGEPGNSETVRKVYDYYQSLYQRNPNLQWAAMARMAGGSVWTGLDQMVDMRLDAAAAAGAIASRTRGNVTGDSSLGVVSSLIFSTEVNLIKMQKEIFEDLAWQHEAYVTSGISELKARFQAKELTPDAYSAWIDIDNGIQTKDEGLIWRGNTALLRREQKVILDRGYQQVARMPGAASQMTEKILNPIPGGGPFKGNDVTNFDQRWPWIEKEMVGAWRNLGKAGRDREMSKSFDQIIDANRKK